MSHDKLCRFWCLLNHDGEEAFAVEADLEWEVSQFAEAIQEKKIYLRGRDTSDIVLLKLNEPIPVDPEETLLQRLPKPITDSSVKLRRTEQVSDAFPNRRKKHVQIIVTLRDTIKRRHPDSPFDTDGDNKRRQKELPRLSDKKLQSMKGLYERIDMLSEEPTKYSAPNEVIDLPFPSVDEIPPRFSLLDERKISYMGRECFSQIWKTFEIVANNPHQRQAIYLFGGEGLGKSHILAALACLLVRKGTQVVYLPDCRAWLFDPLRYLQNALVFAFVNSKPSFREEILDCENLESLANFCARYRNTGQLCFIVDQLNALDPEVMAQDMVSNTEKDSLRKLLHRMSSRHILISSASTNHKTFQHMAKRDTGEKKVPLMEGMTSAEMACWWKYHGFTAFSNEEKQRVEDLTGRIPLLLNPFVMHREKTLEFLEPQIWRDEALESVRREIIDFASAKKSELDDRTYRDQYVLLMRNCLLGREIGGPGMHLDRCYFYLDTNGCARYSCGLARQAITEFLRENGEEWIFLGNEWHKTLENFKNNPSVIGFTVEQILISKMASAGLYGSIVLPAAKIITFEGETTWLSVDEPLAYYVPLNFNKKVIDVLFVRVNRQAQSAQLVAIQITVAKQHKDSEAAFFTELNTWLLGLEGFEVDVSFLWIHEGERGRSEVEEKLKKLRGRTVVISPNHDTHWMSVEQVDVELARTLTRIRPTTKT